MIQGPKFYEKVEQSVVYDWQKLHPKFINVWIRKKSKEKSDNEAIE